MIQTQPRTGLNANHGLGMVGLTISAALMVIPNHGATKHQAAGITVISESAKNVIKKVG